MRTNTDQQQQQQPQQLSSSSDNFVTIAKEALEYSLCLAAKFCYGFLFGTFIWAVIIKPFERFIDINQNSYLAEYIFSISVAALFMSFLRVRAVMVLFLPSLVANATQNYIIIMIFIALFSNPVTNITLNTVESVRVIGCSMTMTFEQLKEKTKLLLSPILEIMKDTNETDLIPIRQDLLNIQKIVINMKQEAEFNRNQSNKDLMIESIKDRQELQAPLPNKQVAMNEITGRLNANLKWAGDVVDKTRGLIEESRIEFDRENFGVKLSLNAKTIQRQLLESRNLLLSSGNGSIKSFNLTGIMYENCLGIFRRAKPYCYDVVEDMRKSCHDTIGSFLGALFCSPTTIGLAATCPWIMDQLVDETSLCSMMHTSISDFRFDPFKITGNASINEVYKELEQQLIGLDDSSSNYESKMDIPERLELSVAFNNQTRRIFFATKDLLDFIKDKYRLRRLLFKFLWLLYDINTAITFVIIILQANRYHENYLAKISYDNNYITGLFVNMDKRRRALGKQSLLPLTKDEQTRYITTFTCKRRTNEEKNTQSASCMMVVLFLAFVLALLYFDDIFYSLLMSIHDHALIYYKEIGHHELEVNVKGEGAIARLVRRLTNRLSSVYDLNKLTSTKRCLPSVHTTTSAFYIHFTSLIVAYLTIDQLSIYAMRLRRVTAAFFYPDKEQKRVAYLYSLILINRRSLQKIGWTRQMDDYDDDGSGSSSETAVKENDYTVKDAFAYLKDCVSRSLACGCYDNKTRNEVKLK